MADHAKDVVAAGIVGIVKITDVPPVVNLYLPAEANVILDVPVSVANAVVWVWLPAAAVVAVVPIVGANVDGLPLRVAHVG